MKAASLLTVNIFGLLRSVLDRPEKIICIVPLGKGIIETLRGLRCSHWGIPRIGAILMAFPSPVYIIPSEPILF